MKPQQVIWSIKKLVFLPSFQ